MGWFDRVGKATHASGICPIALITSGTLTNDRCIDVGIVVRGDVASAATAVGCEVVLSGHGYLCSTYSRTKYLGGMRE